MGFILFKCGWMNWCFVKLGFFKGTWLCCAGVTGVCCDGLGAEMRSVNNESLCDVSFKQRFAERLFPMVQHLWPMPAQSLALGTVGMCGHMRWFGDQRAPWTFWVWFCYWVIHVRLRVAYVGFFCPYLTQFWWWVFPHLLRQGFLFIEGLCDRVCIYCWWTRKVYTTFHLESLMKNRILKPFSGTWVFFFPSLYRCQP